MRKKSTTLTIGSLFTIKSSPVFSSMPTLSKSMATKILGVLGSLTVYHMVARKKRDSTTIYSLVDIERNPLDNRISSFTFSHGKVVITIKTPIVDAMLDRGYIVQVSKEIG